MENPGYRNVENWLGACLTPTCLRPALERAGAPLRDHMERETLDKSTARGIQLLCSLTRSYVQGGRKHHAMLKPRGPPPEGPSPDSAEYADSSLADYRMPLQDSEPSALLPVGRASWLRSFWASRCGDEAMVR